MFEVTGVDLNAGNLSFEDPALPGFPKGGWQGGRNWRTGGVAPGGGIAGDSTVAPLIVDNVKEELDAGGEYYYDETTHELFMIPNVTATTAGTSSNADSIVAGSSSNLTAAQAASLPTTVVAANLQTLIKIKGSQAAPVMGITISGIGIRDRQS